MSLAVHKFGNTLVLGQIDPQLFSQNKKKKNQQLQFQQHLNSKFLYHSAEASDNFGILFFFSKAVKKKKKTNLKFISFSVSTKRIQSTRRK